MSEWVCIRGRKTTHHTTCIYFIREKVLLHTVCVCHKRTATTIRNRRTTTYSIKYRSVFYTHTYYIRVQCTCIFEIDEYYFYMYVQYEMCVCVWNENTGHTHIHTHTIACGAEKEQTNKNKSESSGKHLWKIKSQMPASCAYIHITLAYHSLCVCVCMCILCFGCMIIVHADTPIRKCITFQYAYPYTLHACMDIIDAVFCFVFCFSPENLWIANAIIIYADFKSFIC